MFKDCSSLEYLDFGNSVINTMNYEGIFNGVFKNITQCSESSEWFELLKRGNDYYTIHITCHSHDKNSFLKKCYNKYGNLPNYKYICKSCGKNYYYNNNSIFLASYNTINISCYETPDGYFLDLNGLNPSPKPCYLTCKLCNKEGNESNHNCLECKENYSIIESIYGDYKNCYNETPTSTSITTSNYLITETELNIESPSKIDELIKLFNKSYIDSGNDIEIDEENIIFTFTNTENQKNENANKNKTTIDLGECQNKLKTAYNISKNTSLYITKIDVKEAGMNTQKVEYEVYYPLYNETLIKLDLKKCQGMKVDISIPVNINENNLDKYNKSSEYYNDICSKTTSDNGTDIPLSDRKNIFVDNNLTLCEEDCGLAHYNTTTKKAKCSCLVKISLPLIDEIKFDKDKLYKSFTDIKNFANINLLKCYKNVLNLDSLKKIFWSLFLYTVITIIFYLLVFILF